MGRVSNYWEVAGYVHHNEVDSPTMTIAKCQNSYNDRPSLSKAESEIRNKWHSRYGGYPNRKPNRIEITNVAWVSS